jgi:hypothetical protein
MRRQALTAGVWLASCSLLAICHPAPLDGRPARTSSGSTYRIPLDLTQAETFVVLPRALVPAHTTLRELQVQRAPSTCRLLPVDGVVQYGRRVDILLDEKLDVRIRVSLVTRGDRLAVKIAPLVGVAAGDPLEFTADRLRRSCWALQRRVKDLQRQIASARREQQRITNYLETPGNKPLDLYKAARQRHKNLERQIVAALQELPAIRARCAAYGELIGLADHTHATTEIRFTLHVAQSGD